MAATATDEKLAADLSSLRVQFATEFTGLASRVEASNDRLAETNQRLTGAINELTRKVEEGQKGYIDFRVELGKELSAIQNSLSWVKWIAMTLALPSITWLVVLSYQAIDRAARIEESVVTLKDHAKEQDGRIAKLIELQMTRETSLRKNWVPPQDSNVPHPAPGPVQLEPVPSEKPR